jgi:hypothetical protein
MDRLHTQFNHHSRLSAPSHKPQRRTTRPTDLRVRRPQSASRPKPQHHSRPSRQTAAVCARHRVAAACLRASRGLRRRGRREQMSRTGRRGGGRGRGGGGRNARQLPEKGGASDRPGPNRHPGVLRAIFSTHAAPCAFSSMLSWQEGLVRCWLEQAARVSSRAARQLDTSCSCAPTARQTGQPR